jgi:hypothetical protein
MLEKEEPWVYVNNDEDDERVVTIGRKREVCAPRYTHTCTNRRDKVLHRAYMHSIMIMIIHTNDKLIDDKLFMKA